jgi:CRP/FNR family transcriptional regulator, cyclic AMP receptor protein
VTLSKLRHPDAKIGWLRDIPGFETLSRAEIRTLAATADRTVAPAGRVLVTQGGRGLECFVIAAGELDVFRDGDLVTRIGPGSVVGEVALLDNAVRNADVVAVTDVEVAVFDPRSFRAALSANARFRELVERAAETHRV